MMKEEALTKIISEQARKFQQRALESPQDGKRHDQVRRDEIRLMWRAHNELGWSFAKVGNIFNRDWRTCKEAIESFKPNGQQTPVPTAEVLVLVEAKKAHLEQIASLLGSWRKELEADRKPRGHFDFTYAVEQEPLFSYVLKHSPSVSEKYQPLKELRQQFEAKLTELNVTIAKDCPLGVTEWFSKTAGYYSVQRALGRSSPIYMVCEDLELQTLEVMGRVIVKDLPKGEKDWTQLHRELVWKYAVTPEVTSAAGVAKDIQELQRELARATQTSLLRQEWISYECDYCPGRQRTKSLGC